MRLLVALVLIASVLGLTFAEAKARKPSPAPSGPPRQLSQITR